MYVESGADNDLFITFTIDNANGQQHNYLTLDETERNITFSNLYISNYAKFQILEDGLDRRLRVDKVWGDGTGLIKLGDRQIGTLERITSGNNTASKLQVNLELASGGEFIMSETSTILGLFPTALDLNGVLRGAMNLIIGEGRTMRIGPDARIVPFFETAASQQYDVSFGLFQLDPGSFVIFDPDTGANMNIGTFNVKFNSQIKADFFTLVASDIDIEQGALFTASGGDRRDSEDLDIRTGAGSSVNGVHYGGAAHGGESGEVYEQRTTVGEAYDSLYEPLLAGSRSSDSSGRGGGRIRMNVGNNVRMDGLMTVDGDWSEFGGGSGGSIYIRTYSMGGIGTFSANGGYGNGTSGGGSAGRISIVTTPRNEFTDEGFFSNAGGGGDTTYQAGGGGTVYLEEIRNSVIYRRLILDNNNRPQDRYATINEPEEDITDENGNLVYEFEEVHLLRNAAVHIHPSQTNVQFRAKRLFGDGTGLIHTHADQSFVLEYAEGGSSAFVAGVNLKMDDGSEIIFPSTVYVYGDGIQLRDATEVRALDLDGRLTGVAST